MEYKTRSLTVSDSVQDQPRIMLTGAWLRQWGYTPGDRILVTRTESGEITIKIEMPSAQWTEIKKKKRLEYQLQLALNDLNMHKTTYPILYQKETKSPASAVTPQKLPATG